MSFAMQSCVLITAGHIVCLFTLVMAIFLSLIIITLLHH